MKMLLLQLRDCNKDGEEEPFWNGMWPLIDLPL